MFVRFYCPYNNGIFTGKINTGVIQNFVCPYLNQTFHSEKYLKPNESIPLDAIYDPVLKKDVTIYKMPGKRGIFFTSKMHVDADGAYWAYHPADKGKKCWEDVEKPEKWHGFDCLEHGINTGLIKDSNGNYVLQKKFDPAEGYYVTGTTLEDIRIEDITNPRRYVDAETIPYFVLPHPRYQYWDTGGERVSVGDFGVVINKANGKMAYAIFADTWPLEYGSRIGEGSMALVCALGLNRDPKISGGTEKEEIIYIVFPGSGKPYGIIKTIEEINENGRKWFEEWGGIEQVKAAFSISKPITMGTCHPSLRKGEKGEFVKKLQQALKRAGLYNGEVNGIFESITEESVKNFQSSYNLTINGIVDLETWSILDKFS